MSTDATPSWSGYIFQGEVALCKALETIYDLRNEDIPDTYCLKLEEDEDFSLLINDTLEVFQVKAYLSKNSNRISKYKAVIEELINKYYYQKFIEKNPNDGRSSIETYSLVKRDIPIKSSLITDKAIVDFNPDFDGYFERHKIAINQNYFKLIHGHYTLENIINIIDELIEKIFPDFDKKSIELKRNHCLVLIHKAIKRRHKTKTPESFKLSDIKQWIKDADSAFNEEIAWVNIIKVFLKTINERINDLDENIPNEFDLKEKLESYYSSLDQLDFETLKNIIRNRLNAHKPDEIKSIEDLILYFSTEEINRIIIKCFERTNSEPFFDSLSYDLGDKRFQLSLINLELDEYSKNADKIVLHKYCTNIEKKNVSDINTFITKSLDLEKDNVKEILRDIMKPEILNIPNDLNEENKTNITDIKYDFDFKDVDNFINKINNEGFN